jgi:hypothetical protein
METKPRFVVDSAEVFRIVDLQFSIWDFQFVEGAAGAQVFLLSGAETVYRLTIETMIC